MARGKGRGKKQQQQQQTLRPIKNIQPQQSPTWNRTAEGLRVGERGNKLLTSSFIYRDNEGEGQWRRRMPPLHHISIPRELSSRSSTNDDFDEIARQTDSFVARLNEHSYGIWGNDVQASKAKTAIDEWVRVSMKTQLETAGRGFYKQHSMTPAEIERQQLKWQKAVRRHLFRQCPPAGSLFQAIGTFLWPSDELSIKQVLGTNLEALDPIRTKNSCYIILGDIETQIRVLGNLKDVQDAIVRIRRTFFQAVARQQRPAQAFLLHWKDETIQPERIALADTTSPVEAVVSYHVETWCMSTGRERLPEQSLQHLQDSVMKAVKGLVYYNANISFCVRLGNFKATSYLQSKDGQHSLDEFKSMLEQSQFAGTTVPQLARKHWEDDMLDNIQEAELLIPSDATIERCEDVHPVYVATFVFIDPKDGVHELKVTWKAFVEPSGRRIFDRLPDKWARLDPRSQTHTCLLDVHLLRLDTNFSWHFDIDTTQPVPTGRIPPQLKRFASRVTFKHAYRPDKDVAFASFTLQGVQGLLSVSNAVVYSHQVKDSGYLVDITDDWSWKHSPSQQRLQNESQPRRTRSLSVRHTTWASYLSQNAALDVGKMVKWVPDISEWFPAETQGEDGFTSLIEKLLYIESCVAQTEKDDFTGMTIG